MGSVLTTIVIGGTAACGTVSGTAASPRGSASPTPELDAPHAFLTRIGLDVATIRSLQGMAQARCSAGMDLTCIEPLLGLETNLPQALLHASDPPPALAAAGSRLRESLQQLHGPIESAIDGVLNLDSAQEHAALQHLSAGTAEMERAEASLGG